MQESSDTIIGNEIKNNWMQDLSSGEGIRVLSGSPDIGGADTSDYNTICGNSPNQINPMIILLTIFVKSVHALKTYGRTKVVNK